MEEPQEVKMPPYWSWLVLENQVGADSACASVLTTRSATEKVQTSGRKRGREKEEKGESWSF